MDEVSVLVSDNALRSQTAYEPDANHVAHILKIQSKMSEAKRKLAELSELALELPRTRDRNDVLIGIENARNALHIVDNFHLPNVR